MAITIPAGNGRLILGNNLPEAILSTAFSDTIYGYAGNDTIGSGSSGVSSDDNDYINGGLGNDLLSVFGGNNTVIGGAGDDSIGGGFGNSILNGGAGNDYIYCFRGLDTVIGGTGADSISFDLDLRVTATQKVQYNSPAEGDVLDQIRGFLPVGYGFPNPDQFLISASGFGGGLVPGTLLASQFLSGAGVTSATTSAQRFLFNTTDVTLRFDKDGTGPLAPVFLATMGFNALTLAAIDFTIF